MHNELIQAGVSGRECNAKLQKAPPQSMWEFLGSSWFKTESKAELPPGDYAGEIPHEIPFLFPCRVFYSDYAVVNGRCAPSFVISMHYSSSRRPY